jgi:DIS3-like exonuclease 2
MLPIEMCKICSLSPGDDKLAFSVFWEMTPEAEIVNHFFDRSVIKSCVQLTSEHAQVSLYR